MAKPFLILQLRPEHEAADEEFSSIITRAGLSADRVHRIRLDREPLPEGRDLDAYAGIIVGGGPGCVSDPPEDKDPVEARIEATILGLMPEITERDLAFMGCCYGIGILGHHLGAPVSKDHFGEPVAPVVCELTSAGAIDPILRGLPQRFTALAGHKEALDALPTGAVHLVESVSCPFQMIRFGANVYATQFHPEADGSSFELRIGIYRDKGYFDPADAEALAAACRDVDTSAAGMVLANFVNHFSLQLK